MANLALAYLEEHCTKNGDKSTCCRTQEEIAAFDVIYVYHKFCGTHIPSAIEDGLHDYEEACEENLCNTVDEPFDPMVCPETPIPKTWQEEAHAAGWRPCKHNQAKAKSKPAEEPAHTHSHRRMSAGEETTNGILDVAPKRTALRRHAALLHDHHMVTVLTDRTEKRFHSASTLCA